MTIELAQRWIEIADVARITASRQLLLCAPPRTIAETVYSKVIEGLVVAYAADDVRPFRFGGPIRGLSWSSAAIDAPRQSRLEYMPRVFAPSARIDPV
jgi:hypothetical protein